MKTLEQLPIGTKFTHGKIAQRGRYYVLTGYFCGSALYGKCDIKDWHDNVVGKAEIMLSEKVNVITEWY